MSSVGHEEQPGKFRHDSIIFRGRRNVARDSKPAVVRPVSGADNSKGPTVGVAGITSDLLQVITIQTRRVSNAEHSLLNGLCLLPANVQRPARCACRQSKSTSHLWGWHELSMHACIRKVRI